MKSHVGQSNILLITLDTLRYDVAQSLWVDRRLTTLERYLPPAGWELRHSPASFTYAAHHAIFAGFLPTPSTPGPHPRLFASTFAGSETTSDATYVFDQPTLPEALSAIGYQTICIGGTGFFNPSNPLGRVLPGLFDQSYWSPETSVTAPESPVHQVDRAIEFLSSDSSQRVFLFVNFSAIHQPNWFYAKPEQRNQGVDTLHSHGEALVAIDRELDRLFTTLGRRGPTFCIFCSDHGTAYGEDGFSGHRLAHPVVWNVPYADFLL